MNDHRKSKAELIAELEALRCQLTRRNDGEPSGASSGEDETGAAPEVVSTFPDLTRHRPVEACLPEWERTYRAVIEGVSDALFIVRPEPEGEFRLVLINSAYAAMTGLQPETILGKRIREVFPPDYAEWLRRKYEEGMTASSVFAYEENSEFPVGTLSLSTRLTPILDENGFIVQMVGASRNITSQKLAERSLRKTNRRLINILESITDAFFALDRQWKITYVNPKAELLAGRDRKTLIGKNLWEEFPEMRDTQTYQECRRAMAKQTAVSLEEYHPSRDLWLQLHAYPSQDSLSLYVQDVTARKRAEESMRHSVEKLQKSVDGIAHAMALAVEMRDPYTAGHQRRVSALACAIARETGMPDDQIEVLRMAGLIHDVGKISIPAEILSKPGHLSQPELNIIRLHAQVGYDILKGIDFAPPVALVALQHHERLDGSGYPSGLTGDDIILEARILAVADVVEAMASHRPYRPGLGIDVALEEVQRHKGTRYYAPAVEACLEVFRRYDFDFEDLMTAECI